MVLKDYFKNDLIHHEKESFDTAKLHQVIVQPNMILYLNSHWSTIEDYTASLNKKYRDRYKRAKKKLNSIQSVELSLEEIRNHTSEGT